MFTVGSIFFKLYYSRGCEYGPGPVLCVLMAGGCTELHIDRPGSERKYIHSYILGHTMMGSFLAICRMHLLLVVVLCVRLMMMERCKVTTKLAVTFTHYLLLLSSSSFVSSLVVVLVVLCLDFVASQKHFVWIYFIDMLMRHPPSHRSRNNQCQQHSSPSVYIYGFYRIARTFNSNNGRL